MRKDPIDSARVRDRRTGWRFRYTAEPRQHLRQAPDRGAQSVHRYHGRGAGPIRASATLRPQLSEPGGGPGVRVRERHDGLQPGDPEDSDREQYLSGDCDRRRGVGRGWQYRRYFSRRVGTATNLDRNAWWQVDLGA